MAKFNANIVDPNKLTQSDYTIAGITLQGFLSDEDHAKLERDWRKKYGDNPSEYPYWKYCLDKIQVSYKPRS